MTHNKNISGFTLIELSIVLVIIGLIVGGILVGVDLVNAAAIRSQISQIERYNTAVNTFRVKYGYLPGDIPDPQASQFGFIARGQYAGEGDGNGLIQGVYLNQSLSYCGYCIDTGETGTFWVDLSTALLIDGGFNTVTPSTYVATNITGATINKYLPTAKIGGGNYVYVWSDYSTNYYGIMAIGTIAPGGLASPSYPGLSVLQAYNIDKKIDDGLPQSGSVKALYMNQSLVAARALWASGGGLEGPNSGAPSYGATTSATLGTSTTCYDNGGGSGPMQYSIGQSNGSNVNCALSFKFQ